MKFDRQIYRCEPTQKDIAEANKQIGENEGAIAVLEERIAALRTQMQHLRKEQDKHKEAIHQCKGVVTLARRIPEELLSKIFEHCVDDGWTRAPTVVSHVCSAWRRAARAPRVWSHVYVVCGSPDVLPRTRYALAMSRQAPLNITLVATHDPDWQVAESVDLLLQHVSRWRMLTVETDSVSRLNTVVSRIKRAVAVAPYLHELAIETAFHFDDHPEDSEASAKSLASAFTTGTAPRLMSLRYTANVIPLAPIFPAHLRELALTVNESPFGRPLSAASLITLLEGVPCLHTLQLSMPLYYEYLFVPEQDPNRTVTLPALEILMLHGPTDLNEFLPHMRTPALRQLYLRSLEDLGYRQQPIGPSLLRFLSPSHIQGPEEEQTDSESSPPIELLEMHDIDLGPEAFAACFAALSKLRELRLHESSISDATVKLLYGPNGLCPRLTKLDLRWCGHLNGQALVGLVRSRTSVVDGDQSDLEPVADPIDEIAVINCCFVEERDILDIASLTMCRVVMRETHDYCRTRGCCDNARYRTRLRFRHMMNISANDRTRMQLIL